MIRLFRLHLFEHERRAGRHIDGETVSHLRILRPGVVDHGLVHAIKAAKLLVVAGELNLPVAEVLLGRGHEQPGLGIGGMEVEDEEEICPKVRQKQSFG